MPKKTPVRLALDPNRCDRCGRCTSVCEPGALKVGASYIYVDWRACNECYACVKACDRGAIVRRESSRKAAPAPRTRASTAGQAQAKTPAKQRSSSPRPRRKNAGAAVGEWSLLEAGAVLAVLLVALLTKNAVQGSAAVDALRPSEVVTVRVGTLLVFYALQVGVVWLFVRRRGAGMLASFSMGALDTGFASKLTSAGLVALLLVGTRAAGWIYGLMARSLGWDPSAGLATTFTSLFGPGGVGLLLSIILVVLVGPVIEEMVFRGVLLHAFEVRWGMWFAVVAQAVLFALYHFNAWLFVPTLLLGLATGWLALERKSLWPAIVLHVLYNLTPVLLAFWPVAHA